jgi:hypothetical protein
VVVEKFVLHIHTSTLFNLLFCFLQTMLISYLCSWLRAHLIILDIHGGTSEEDILAIFNSATSYLNESGEPEVYVFLDEVNTCSHMGVIAEAICHRSLNGARLHDGIKVLAALNPYRIRPSKADDVSGLAFGDISDIRRDAEITSKIKKQHLDPMRRLVYRVHPVPLVMQDFIFDFGGISSGSFCARIFTSMICCSSKRQHGKVIHSSHGK